MANFFDQFDKPAAAQEAQPSGNFFDQFDKPEKTVGFTGEPAQGIGSRRTSGVLGLFSIPNIVEGLYNAVKAAPQVTKNVMEGKLDPASEEGIKQIAPLAALAGTPSPARALTKVPPTRILPEAVADASAGGYQKADALGVQMKPDAINRGLTNLRKDIASEIEPDLAKTAMSMLDKEAAKYSPPALSHAEKVLGVKPKELPPVETADLTSFREKLNEAIQDNSISNKDRKALLMARTGIDDMLTTLQPHEVIKGNPKELAETLTQARGDYAGLMRQNAIQDIQTRALDRAGSSHSGANLENALRQEFRSFIRPNRRGVSEAKRSGFTEDEVQQIRDFVREGPSDKSNAQRAASNFLGGGGGLGGLITSMGGHALMGKLGFAAPLLGYGLKRAGNSAALAGAEALAQSTLARTPYGQTIPQLPTITARPTPALPPPTLAAPYLFQQTPDGFPFFAPK